MDILSLIEQIDNLYSDEYRLLESPMIIDTDISSIYLDNKLTKLIKRGLEEQSFLRHKFENKNIWVYSYSKIGEIFVITTQIDNKTIFIGGANITRVRYCNAEYLQPVITKKFSEYKNFMYDIYRFANKLHKIPIISDYMQSESAYNIWKKWYLNPNNYNIKSLKAFYKCLEEKDIDKIWNKNIESKDYRLILDFI